MLAASRLSLSSSRFLQLFMGLPVCLRNVMFYLLWKLVHLIISAYTLSLACFSYLNLFSRFRDAIHWHQSFKFARNDSKHCSKIPPHLGLVFTEKPERFSAENLADLITWGATFGAAYVSVYDSQGLDVMFLKNSDGKSAVAASAREICRDVVSNATSLIKIDQHLLDLYIRRRQLFPDPDLVLKIGRLNSLVGYLPWHTRLTEITYCPRSGKVSYAEFRSAMERYARVEQRVGR